MGQTMQKFKFQTKVVEKSAQITIVGEINSANAAAFKKNLLTAINLGTPTVLLDLSEVKRIDSAGVAVLVECYKALKLEGRKFGLVRVPAAICKILDLLGIVDVVFDVYSDMAEGRRMTAQVRRLHDSTQKMSR